MHFIHTDTLTHLPVAAIFTDAPFLFFAGAKKKAAH